MSSTFSPPVRGGSLPDNGLSSGTICAIVAGIVALLFVIVTSVAYGRHYVIKRSEAQRRYNVAYQYGTPGSTPNGGGDGGTTVERIFIDDDDLLGGSPPLLAGSPSTPGGLRQNSVRRNPLADI